jgi:hypothetical protein
MTTVNEDDEAQYRHCGGCDHATPCGKDLIVCDLNLAIRSADTNPCDQWVLYLGLRLIKEGRAF